MTTKFKVGETYRMGTGCEAKLVAVEGDSLVFLGPDMAYVRDLYGKAISDAHPSDYDFILPKRRLKCWVQWNKTGGILRAVLSTYSAEKAREMAGVYNAASELIGDPIEVLGPEVDDE